MSKVLPSFFVLVLFSCAAPSTTLSQPSRVVISGQRVMQGSAPIPANMQQALATWVESLRKISPSGDVDEDFATLMKVFHQGAQNLAQVQLARGRSSDMKAIANAIRVVRQREISYLNRWLASEAHAPRAGSSDPSPEMAPSTTLQSRIVRLERTPLVGDIDIDFATIMKALDQEAMDAVKTELLQGRSVELRSTARQMLSVQTKEIAQLSRWLSRQNGRIPD